MNRFHVFTINRPFVIPFISFCTGKSKSASSRVYVILTSALGCFGQCHSIPDIGLEGASVQGGLLSL